MDDSFGSGPKPPSVILDDENFREFFRNQELWLKTRGWLYVFEQTREEFASVILPENNQAANKNPILNLDRKEKFDRHDASARYSTRHLLNSFDRELFDSISCSRDAWNAVKSEYLRSDSKDVRKLEKEITHWKKESGLSIKRAWVQLNELRSKLVEADPLKSNSYTEASLFGFLLEGLDNKIYKTAKNVLDLQPNLTRKQRLDSLQNFFEENEADTDQDLSALAARNTEYNRGRPSRTNRQTFNQYPQRRSPSHPNQSVDRSEICYMCGGQNHHVRNCEFRHAARQFAEKLRLDKESREDLEPHHKISFRPQYKRGSPSKAVKFTDKSKAFWSDTEASSEWSDGDKSDILTDDDEVSALITDEVRKTFNHSDSFISDTGCTNDMTDKHHLFTSDLRPISRRWIKVGGGRLFSDFQGDVVIRCPDGSSGLLRDVLLVEGLGVNLLSAKKFCERNDAIGIFNDKEMLFHNKNNELILSAKLEDNLYKVNHISGPNERALLGQDSSSNEHDYMPMTIDNTKNNLGIDDGEPLRSRAEIIEKNRADRYWLHHRRCGHAGTRVISLLHTITDIDRPVKIPSNLELCDICLTTKMKKFRSKKLSEHKDEKLALVSVDIAGPFPESIDGHKYFVEIIDSYTRKKWVLLLKSKSEIVTALDEWGNLVERQSGCLIMAVRSDNASEILKVLKSWKRNNGVVSQTTAPYSSHQNGAAERAIQSTVYATRAMLKEAGLPVEFWAEAAQTHTYITNRIRAGPTLTKTEGENMTTKRVSPEEAWTGNPVSIRHLRIFGCKAFAHIDRKSHPKHSRKDKLMDVGRECIFVGYTDTMSQYRLYAPDLHRVFTSSYTKFKENDKGSSIKDLRLWRKSGLEFTEGQGNSSPAIRNAPGRPCRISKRKSLNGGGSFAINSGFNVPNIQTESISTTPSTITPNIIEKSIPNSNTEISENHNDYATDIKVSNCLNEDKASIMQPPVVTDSVGVIEPNSNINIIEAKSLGDHISPRRSERLKAKRTDHISQNNSVNTGEKLTEQSLLKGLSSKSKNMKKDVQLKNDPISISLPKVIESNLKSPIISKSSDPSGEPMHEKNQPIQSTLSLLHPEDSNTRLDDAQLKHATIKVPSIQVASFTVPPDKAQQASSSIRTKSIPDGQEKQTDKPHDIENNTALTLPQNPLTDLMIIDDNKLKVYAGEKRKRSDLYEIEKDDERRSKILKAMLAIIDIVDKMDSTYTENAFISEFLVSTALVSEDIPIPKSYKQAISDPTYGKLWKDAIEEEIRSLTANQTWEEVFTPQDTNLISSKWVFTIKSKPDGSFDRFKARLVAKGFTQRLGADYQETFAPTVQMATLRAFLAICAVEDLELVHFDVKNAFTEASPEESLFLRAPEGVDVKPGNALKVLRSLYGLKQAARDWNQLLKSKILAWGFVQSLADPCLFSHKKRKINILIYVDDIAVAAKSKDSVNWFFKNMNECFNTKNLGDMEMFLGIRITRDRKEKTLWLDQQQYLERTLEKFGIPNAKHRPVSIPLDGYDSLTPANNDEERIDPKEYSMIIGSLMFAMVYTRADIAFALGRLSQYMKEPTKKHGQALKKLMRYLRFTSDYRLCFKPGESVNLVVYSDADWASDKVDRKSVSGGVGMLCGAAIFWLSRKQKSVTTSTAEAEYASASIVAKLGQWMAQVLRDMGYPEYIAPNGITVETRGDNQGAIALIKNPHLNERSKHIDICYHHIRDLHDNKRISTKYIPSQEMIADGLTKPLSKGPFEKFVKLLGMCR